MNGGAVGWQRCSPCQQDPKTRVRGKIHELICLGRKKLAGLGLLKLKSAQREERGASFLFEFACLPVLDFWPS